MEGGGREEEGVKEEGSGRGGGESGRGGRMEEGVKVGEGGGREGRG